MVIRLIALVAIVYVVYTISIIGPTWPTLFASLLVTLVHTIFAVGEMDDRRYWLAGGDILVASIALLLATGVR